MITSLLIALLPVAINNVMDHFIKKAPKVKANSTREAIKNTIVATILKRFKK